MNADEGALVALCLETAFDLRSHFMFRPGEQLCGFVLGGSVDVLLTVKPVAVAVLVEVRGLGSESSQSVSDRSGLLACER